MKLRTVIPLAAVLGLTGCNGPLSQLDPEVVRPEAVLDFGTVYKTIVPAVTAPTAEAVLRMP